MGGVGCGVEKWVEMSEKSCSNGLGGGVGWVGVMVEG